MTATSRPWRNMVGLVAHMIERNTLVSKEPWFARLDEMLPIVAEDFKGVFRGLVRNKTLTFHPDINGRMMFEFTPPGQPVKTTEQ